MNDQRPPTESTPLMIEAVELSKFYGSFAATSQVTFSVPQGEVAAFLGPNGAGKSTTMKLLTGYLTPSEGSCKIGGFDVLENRIEASRLVGYLPENGPLYNEMTPKGLLKFLGKSRSLTSLELKRRLEFVIEKCSLKDVLYKSISKLSRGYRQRVGMAQALLHDPKVLILDEPTSGLDPNQLHDARELIRDLGQTKTILLSTHILQEVKAVCSRVLLINEGKLVFNEPVDQMGSDSTGLEQQFRKLTTASVS